MTSPTEISIQQLSKLIGTPDCPIIIDVRLVEDFELNPRLIPSAIRCDFEKVNKLIPKLHNRKAVLYCQKGFKISQGAAAILRANGVQTETLKGGIISWSQANFPKVDANKISTWNEEGQSVWVTRQRPKIDRIACPWFIRRFVDPNAQFLFVAPSQVLLVAEKFNATPFDVEDVFWSHENDKCTFDRFISEFGIDIEPLARMAEIIRGADTNCHNLAAECAGLVAISLGLSRMYKDDLQQLEAGMLVYDALYRWCRDAVSEGHDWPTTGDKQ